MSEHDTTLRPESTWQMIVGAAVHVLPIFYFIPYAFLFPLLAWLIFRKHTFIAHNARVAALYWVSVQIILTAIAWTLGWGWLLSMLWFVAALWAILAALAVWADLGNVYPPQLCNAARYWEKVEPGVISWLVKTFNASWQDTKDNFGKMKTNVKEELKQSNSIPKNKIEKIPTPPISALKSEIPVREFANEVFLNKSEGDSKSDILSINPKFPVLSGISILLGVIGGICILTALCFIALGLKGNSDLFEKKSLYSKKDGYTYNTQTQEWDGPPYSPNKESIYFGISLFLGGVFTLLSSETVRVALSIEKHTRCLHELEKSLE